MSYKKIFLLAYLLILFIIVGCGSKIEGESNRTNPEKQKNLLVAHKSLSEKVQEEKNKYKVTFYILAGCNV